VSSETWPKSFCWFQDPTDIITFFDDSGKNQASTKGERRHYEGLMSAGLKCWYPCETPVGHMAEYVLQKGSPAPPRHPADIAFAAEINAAFLETNRQEIQLRYQRAVDRLNAAIGTSEVTT